MDWVGAGAIFPATIDPPYQTAAGSKIINKKYLFGTIGTTDQPHENSARRQPARRKEVNEELKNHQNHYCSDSGKEGGAYCVTGSP